MKIIDKMNAAMAQGRPFFSFEFFPPRTDEVINLQILTCTVEGEVANWH